MEYVPALPNFSHQQEAFEQSADLSSFSIFWEQGTGKTKAAIDTACYLYEQGAIDACIVVAPNGVHLNWLTDELPTHVPERLRAKTKGFIWQPNKTGTKWFKRQSEQFLRYDDGMAWLFFSYDGFMTKLGKNFAWRFLRRRRCFYALDESHAIKNPSAKRTMSIVASGKYAPYRRIMSGTPIATGPFDAFSQVKFCDEQFWKDRGIGNFTVFKRRYGEWFTRADAEQALGYDPGYDQLIRYRNIDELNSYLSTVSSRVLKDDVLDLPPKLYSKRYFELTPKQRSAYERLRDEFEVELESGAYVDGSMALTRLLRLQQITSGYLPTDDDEEPFHLFDGKNPRLDTAMEICGGLYHQCIIWARFTRDIDQLMDALGDKAVRYDGVISADEAKRSKEAFQAGDAQFFVAKPQKGREGLTFNMAKTSIYYTNSFNYIDRTQSEDRNHRIGQDQSVEYIDLVAPGTVDQKIVKSLRDKYDIASQITGDELKEWL